MFAFWAQPFWTKHWIDISTNSREHSRLDPSISQGLALSILQPLLELPSPLPNHRHQQDSSGILWGKESSVGLNYGTIWGNYVWEGRKGIWQQSRDGDFTATPAYGAELWHSLHPQQIHLFLGGLWCSPSCPGESLLNYAKDTSHPIMISAAQYL